MDALRRSLVILLAVTAVICIVPMTSDASDAAGEMDGLMLYEINPWDDHEGVSVHNYGDGSVDLKNYIISDNPNLSRTEGYITFSESIIVNPGETVAVASASGGDCNYINRDDVTIYYIGSNGIDTEGSFNLSNSGDDVYLFLDGTVIDAVCYGDKLIEDSALWASYETVDDRRDVFFQRHGTYDTDSEEDWSDYIPGWTNYEFDENLKFDSEVTPFLFPDHGGIPVYQVLESAQTSVYIEIYMITEPNVYALLTQLVQNGVEVKVLLEGDVLAQGYDPVEDMESYIQYFVDAGGEVRLIGDKDSGVVNRFSYVHAKYAVIDGEMVLVTSENWTPSNLNGSIDENPYSGNDGNRGWGAVIDSSEYATFMKSVFDNDWSMSYGDVIEFEEKHKDAIAVDSMTFDEPDSLTLSSYSANVTPVLSNDNSYDAIQYYISNANTRVYAEQQSLGVEFRDMSPSSPVSMMNERAKAGVECYLILDDTNQNNDDQVDVINKSSLVPAALMTGSTTLHNKGLICDDYVWVSSINWTTESFNNNREVCAVIESSEIADYFAEHLLEDFDQFYTSDGKPRVDISEIEETYPSGQDITFTVTVRPEGDYSYTWDIGDGSEPIDTNVPRIVCQPVFDGDATVYVLTVTVTDNDSGLSSTVSREYTILAEGSGDQGLGDIGQLISDNLYILIPLIVIILGAIAAVGRSGKKRSSKKRK